MSVIKGFVYKYKKIIILISIILISFILMFSSSKTAVITLKRAGLSMLYPFQYIISTTGQFFQNTFNSISKLKESQEEIKDLRNELNQYKRIIIDFNQLNNEINDLKTILELKENITYDSIACEIIAGDPQTLFDVFIINKGFKDGINENMPVIAYTSGKRTLIGKVVETTPFSAKVITLHNPQFSVGAIISSNKSHAIVQGSNIKPGIVRLLYVPKDFFLSSTDVNVVYTSGDSLIFPSGLEIGQIVKIYPSKRYEMFNEADIRLSTDLSKVNYVLVLKVNYKTDDFKMYLNNEGIKK